MKRPFWMHQLVEYVIGVLLISQGLQAGEPAVPTLIGAAVLVNAAIAKGPLSAFPKVPRAIHRIVDAVLLAVTVVAACLPASIIDSSTRAILIGVAAVLAFVVWRTDYREKPTRRRRATATPTAPSAPAAPTAGPAGGPTAPPPSAPGPPGAPSGLTGAAAAAAARRIAAIDSEELGRKAGKTAGKLYNAARRRKRS